MELPNLVPVMTLPNATLFPQALLPLYIFEPRYRQMLVDTLKAKRMFSVAMQRPGRTRETPCPVAGLGLIRVSVDHQDGTKTRYSLAHLPFKACRTPTAPAPRSAPGTISVRVVLASSGAWRRTAWGSLLPHSSGPAAVR